MLIVALMVAVLALAYANGANDNFKAAATVYGSGALSYRASLILATVAQLAGSAVSLLLAGALVKAFGGKGLLPPDTVAQTGFLVSVGLGAATTVLLATRLGLPVSTTHGLVGGLLGAGLAYAPGAIAWTALGSGFVLPLILSPFLALAGAVMLYPVARWWRRKLGWTAETHFCLGQTVEPVTLHADSTAVAMRTGLTLTAAERRACITRYSGQVWGVSAQRLVESVHTVSAFALGFARGLNDTPKILALLVAASLAGVDIHLALGATAGAMALGGLLHSRRLAQTMGKGITTLNPGQGLVGNLTASALVIGASLLGSPVSTTHVSNGAIFGIGVWTGSTRWRLVATILLAWVATLPIAALVAYELGRALS